MKILSRKKTDHHQHVWASTVNSGLRRSICSVCGQITLEPTTLDLTVSESLQKVVGEKR